MPAWPTHLTLQPTDARTEVQSGHNYFLIAPCIQHMWELEEKTGCEMCRSRDSAVENSSKSYTSLEKKIEEVLPNLITILNMYMLLPMASCEPGRTHISNNNPHQFLISHPGRLDTFPFSS